MTIVSCPQCEAPFDARGLWQHRGSGRCYAIIATRDLLDRGLIRAAGWPYYFVLPKAGIETVKGYFVDRRGKRFVMGRYYAKRHTWGPAWAVGIVRALYGRVSTSELLR